MPARVVEHHNTTAAEPQEQERQSSIQITIDRGTETLKSVLAQIGQENIKTLQVTVNEVEFLVKAAQIAARTITRLGPAEQKLNAARVRGLKRIVELRKAAEPVLETGEVCELLGVSRETIRKKVDRRQLSLMVVSEKDLLARSLSTFSTTSLKCVDLTGAGLRKLSCDNRISTDKPYQTVGLWSRALYIHPQQPDGIIYRSRHNPRFRCLALFDQCDSKLTDGATQTLMGPTWRAWTAVQLTRHNLDMV
jgi:hypothetical protein